MSEFCGAAIRTLKDINRVFHHGGNGPITDDEYDRIIATDEVNRILRETEYKPPKTGGSRGRKRERPVSFSDDEEENAT